MNGIALLFLAALVVVGLFFLQVFFSIAQDLFSGASSFVRELPEVTIAIVIGLVCVVGLFIPGLQIIAFIGLVVVGIWMLSS